jgi:hypothetical protein
VETGAERHFPDAKNDTMKKYIASDFTGKGGGGGGATIE